MIVLTLHPTGIYGADASRGKTLRSNVIGVSESELTLGQFLSCVVCLTHCETNRFNSTSNAQIHNP